MTAAYRVRGADELALDDEKILVFEDLRVDKTGQIAKFGGLIARHNGREGNVRLINGTSEPEMTMAAGQIERWRIVNASSARYVRLSLGGLPFQILATDGGFIEAPVSGPMARMSAAIVRPIASPPIFGASSCTAVP